MKKFFLPFLALVGATTLFQGCIKSSTSIDESQVIQTPYSLFFTDNSGAMFVSNDGIRYKTVVASDGYPDHALITDGANIVRIKKNIMTSTNNGATFNFSYGPPDLAAEGFVDALGNSKTLNQSMIINIPKWGHTYVASREITTGQNYFGMAGSVAGSIYLSWGPQNFYDTIEVIDASRPVWVTSFTSTKSDTLFAFSAITQTTMYRSGPANTWAKTYATTPIPLDSTKAWYSLGHIGNRIIVIDNKGTAVANGGSPAYYSDDRGNSWIAYSGLPSGTPLNCISTPFEQICLVGTEGKGLYTLNMNTNTFQRIGNGLPADCVVRNIAFKENIYKNGNKKQYVYVATNSGIYQSTDLGFNFVKTIPGNYTTIY